LKLLPKEKNYKFTLIALCQTIFNRQAPLGQEQWQVKVATKYGILSTLRRRGRASCDS